MVVTAGQVVDRPVVRDETVVARQMLPLTVSLDHVVIDGTRAARFTRTLVQLIESAAAFDTPTRSLLWPVMMGVCSLAHPLWLPAW